MSGTLPTRDLDRMQKLGRLYMKNRDGVALEEAATYLAVVGTYTPEGASLRIWWEEGTRNVHGFDTLDSQMAMDDLTQRAWELKDAEDLIDFTTKFPPDPSNMIQLA